MKNKNREKKVQEKLKFRREKIRQKAKLDREVGREQMKLRERLDPIVRDDKYEETVELRKRKEAIRIEKAIESDISEAKKQLTQAENSNLSKNVIGRLENNYRILLSLQEEFLLEQESRQQLNQELEGEGLSTLKEKVDYLSNKAKNIQQSEAELESPKEI